MDKYDCSCGGLNGNCFRCFGTGLVQSSAPAVGRPHRALTPSLVSSLSKKKRRNRKDESKRSIAINPEIDAHGAGPKSNAPPLCEANPVKSDTVIPTCPICKKQTFTLEELRSHIINGHGIKIPSKTKLRLKGNKATTSVPKLEETKPNMPLKKRTLSKRKPMTTTLKLLSPSKKNVKDDVDALDHPNRLPGSYGTGKRR
jgi:hypothetical protein